MVYSMATVALILMSLMLAGTVGVIVISAISTTLSDSPELPDNFDWADPSTYPPVPADWDWLPETESWIAQRGSSPVVETYDFILWHSGLNQHEWDYLVFRYNTEVDTAMRAYYQSFDSLGPSYQPPAYTDPVEAYRAYYRSWLTPDQITKVDILDPKIVPQVYELMSHMHDELMMRNAVHNSIPLSNYYRKYWYVYYRYCPPFQDGDKKYPLIYAQPLGSMFRMFLGTKEVKPWHPANFPPFKLP